MEITDVEFKELIKKPLNGDAINLMINDEAEIAALSTGEGFDVMRNKFAELYPTSLASTIRELFKPHTQKLLAPFTGSVHSHYLKIFDSYEKRKVTFNFENEDLYSDFVNYTRSAYLNDLGALQFSKEYLTTDILYSPNTRYYADFEPNEENKGASLPIIKRVTPKFIHDIKESNGTTDYIIFHQCTEKDKVPEEYFLIDEYRYAKAVKNGNDWKIEASIEHDFNKTPVVAASNAKFFANGACEVKKSVISDSLEDLKAWVLTKNQDKVFFWRNQTPREYAVASKCKGTYDNSDNTHYSCDGGYYKKRIDIEDPKTSVVTTTYKTLACSSCYARKKEMNKFGSMVTVAYEDLVRNSDKIQKIKDGFGYISTDHSMLKESKQRVEDDLAAIETAIIGRATGTNILKEAINEKQVKLNGESKEQTLTSFAEQVESKEMFLFDLLGKGRYNEKYSYSNVYLGRRWVFSEQDIASELKHLKDANASIVLIKRKQEELITSSYSHDNEFLTIAKLANALIPFQDVSISELVANSELYINQSGAILYSVRINSDKMLAYLENEFKSNINLQLMPFEEQTKAVYTLFTEYLNLNK